MDPNSLKPLKVAFIWHMHQPYYKDLKTNRYLLPWVRLHALKDYYDMVAILDNYPGISMTFNLVPTLIEQLQDYSSNSVYDRHLFLTEKRADQLTSDEKLEIVRDFFMGNQSTMIKSYPRFYQLLLRRGEDPEKFPQIAQRFSPQDFLDLQVWSNLVWFDPIFRKDAELAPLFKKKENFTEEDKKMMLSKQKSIIHSILPKYKELKDKGQIEITISPCCHPILPLLCNTDIAKVSQPNTALPLKKFSHPEDALAQINCGVEFFERVFGGKPNGMWPSEGGVSEDIVPLIAQAGIKWAATDEEILYLSMKVEGFSDHYKNDLLYKPYEVTVKGSKLFFVFRDHLLSDLIGFVYSRWDPQKAADDLINRLLEIRKNLKEEEIPESIVSIILDGENCWEYYKNDGHDFLNALYTGLSKEKSIQTTTVSKFLDETQVKSKLPSLYPGSWIDHNFKIWIGEPEDNLAWDLLNETRERLVEFQQRKGGDIPQEKLKAAWKEIYVAEGSDWCWWYGSTHSGPGSELFDLLFRSHLLSVYDIMELEPPQTLFQSLRTAAKVLAIQEPTNFITPTLDGKVTHFYEWEGAGVLDCVKLSGVIRRAVSVVKHIYFGHDLENLYLRIDTVLPVEKYFAEDYRLDFEIFIPSRFRLPVSKDKASLCRYDQENKKWKETSIPVNFAFARVLELSLPLSAFEQMKEKGFQFRVIVRKGEDEIERCPEIDLIKFSFLQADKTPAYW
ncbi:MAG: glycoside hydrolase family 57 protein [candidate division Zixibacteria bacterium]|nr:glycoside hydrolase family 57 protein [candidate division Zixibacteria bacterium]